MKLTPTYPHLTNSLIIDKGLEYFQASNKALSIVHLMNHTKNSHETIGFLFSDIQSISQKLKNEQIANDLGVENIGLLHCIYECQLSNGYMRYIINFDYSFMIVEAKKVELIEGLMYA